MLVGEKTNKVVSYKVFSRICSLCHRNGDKGHEGPCNSNFDGTAKSMEPVGMMECLTVAELIVDNDGNTMAAIQVISKNTYTFT